MAGQHRRRHRFSFYEIFEAHGMLVNRSGRGTTTDGNNVIIMTCPATPPPLPPAPVPTHTIYCKTDMKEFWQATRPPVKRKPFAFAFWNLRNTYYLLRAQFSLAHCLCGHYKSRLLRQTVCVCVCVSVCVCVCVCVCVPYYYIIQAERSWTSRLWCQPPPGSGACQVWCHVLT